MSQTHEFALSEERLVFLQRRILFGVAGLFVLAQVGLVVFLLLQESPFSVESALSALMIEIPVVVVTIAVVLSVRYSLIRQLQSVVVRIQEDRLIYRTPLAQKEVGLHQVRKIRRTMDGFGRIRELTVIDDLGNTIRLVGFREMDALNELICGSLPPGIEPAETETGKDWHSIYGVICAAFLIIGLFAVAALGQRYLSDYQVILAAGFFMAVLCGVMMPFLLWKGGVRGPGSKRTYLFFGFAALAYLAIAVLAAWAVSWAGALGLL